MKIRSVMRDLGEFTAAELATKLAELNPALNPTYLRKHASEQAHAAERTSLLKRTAQNPARWRWWELPLSK